ncbi:MAG: MBL fold metallo-hydrolase [Candidatus Heimdallarchaeota archaeon]|nr:MBL fold metallo-hydrolase [Candidatus Heimdallarchaeota archaeon]MCK4876386.1 MBL fold metallo-hydrolase [Candidatus Heimdallarchaeota archaeon]
MNDIEIIAHGSTNYVGRSAFVIRDRDRSILLDCGIELVPKQLSRAPVGVDPIAENLDAFILSHAHIDHSGYVPKLAKKGYKGDYHMTDPTKEVVYKLWLDHLKIEGRRHWSERDLDKVYQNIKTHNYKRKFKIADGITAEFLNAGHVLGAAQVLIDWDGTLILYTGDINDRVTPMFDGYDLPEEKIDVLLIESTNGDRYVPERKKIDVGLRLLAKQIADEGNKMILPSFAVGRSQETLITLALDQELDDIPIYIDGMINHMNMVTEHFLSENWVSKRFLTQIKEAGMSSPFRKDNFIPVPSLSERTSTSRKYISNKEEGSIIVTTSGMLEGGPIHSYLELLGTNENNVLGFTGYQVDGTTGRAIYDGERKVTLFADYGKKKQIDLEMQIMKFPYSGHSSVDGLKLIMEKTGARDIILIHGDKRNQEYILNYVKDVAQPRLLKEGFPEKLRSV